MLKRFTTLGLRASSKCFKPKMLPRSNFYRRNQTVMRFFSDSQPEDSDADFKPKYKNLTESQEVDSFEKINFAENELEEAQVVEKLRQAISTSPVVIFIKGDFDRPMCGYSNLIVQIMHFYNVKKGAFLNVLDNNDVRSHGKIYIRLISSQKSFRVANLPPSLCSRRVHRGG